MVAAALNAVSSWEQCAAFAWRRRVFSRHQQTNTAARLCEAEVQVFPSAGFVAFVNEG
jgi:hypothetical protein